MDLLGHVATLGQALKVLKGMYDQHKDNKKEIKELQDFIEQYEQQLPDLQERFMKCKVNPMGAAVMDNLEAEIIKATSELQKWSTNKNFFRVFTSSQRMQELQKLHRNVMASMQKNVGIAGLSMMLDIRSSQIDLHADLSVQLKSLLSTNMSSMSSTRVQDVRSVAFEASRSTYADEKFWADVLAAVDGKVVEVNTSKSMDGDISTYLDPILGDLMVDPIVASNGITYCRWTIIDNHVLNDPHNPSDDLVILADNVSLRGELLRKYPAQLEKFQQRRDNYRQHALALASEGRFADAMLALEHVLLWNKSDERCAATLVQVQAALKEEQLRTASKMQQEIIDLQQQLNVCHSQMKRMEIENEELNKKLKDQEDSTRTKMEIKDQEFRDLLKFTQNLQIEIQKMDGWKSNEVCENVNISLSKKMKDVMERYAALQEILQNAEVHVTALSKREEEVQGFKNQLKNLQDLASTRPIDPIDPDCPPLLDDLCKSAQPETPFEPSTDTQVSVSSENTSILKKWGNKLKQSQKRAKRSVPVSESLD